MSNNNLTAVIITGTPDQISTFINRSFSNISSVNFELPKVNLTEDVSIKTKYSRPTDNLSCQDLTKSQIQAVDKYLSSNKSFKFKDLVTYLKTKTKVSLPSNAAISNHLMDSDYSRYQYVLNNNKSFFTWEKS